LEAVIGVLLLVGATVLVVTNESKTGARDLRVRAGPGAGKPAVLSAVAMRFGNSRANDFSFWRNTAVRRRN